MKLSPSAALLVVLVCSPAVVSASTPWDSGQQARPEHAQGAKPGQGKAKGAKAGDQAGPRAGVAFARPDLTLLREHYGARYRNLPPGLQKKLARGGALPPGWAKKLEPLPYDLDRRLRPLPAGYRRGVVDGYAVIYDPRAGVIIDFAELF